MSEYFVSDKISSRAVADLLKELSVFPNPYHTLEVYENNEPVLRLASDPYSCADKRENFSLSKSFTSTAVGMAIYDGKLSLDTPIITYFADELPAYVPPELATVTVRNLLTMTSGHDTCCYPAMGTAENAAKAFLASPFLHKPGTHFAYDTGASCMLAILLEKVTGYNPLDYLSIKFFPLAGIEGVMWEQTDDGHTEGGIGIYASCDDIVQLGLLYANDGVVAGTRLLSHEWVTEVGTPQVNFCNNGETPTHDNGYSFQFWMKREDGFDAEGAYGQYCIVFPARKLVIVSQSLHDGTDPMLPFYRFIDHMHDKDDAPAEIVPCTYTPAGSDNLYFKESGNVYFADPNPMGIRTFSLTETAEGVQFAFSDGKRQQVIHAGNGAWVQNAFFGKHMMPKLSCMHNDDEYAYITAGASVGMSDTDPVMTLRLKNSPGSVDWRFHFKNRGWECRIYLNSTISDGLCASESEIVGHLYLRREAHPAKNENTLMHNIVNLKSAD